MYAGGGMDSSLLDYRFVLLDEGIGDLHGTIQGRDQDDRRPSADNKTQSPLLIQQAAILGIYRGRKSIQNGENWHETKEDSGVSPNRKLQRPLPLRDSSVSSKTKFRRGS